MRALGIFLMNDRQRLLLAFVLSPLTMPLMWAALAAYWGVSYGEIQMGIGFIFMPAAYAAATVFGLPIFFLYRALGWKNVFMYISGGVAMGSATGVALGALEWEIDLTTLALCSAAGASSGLVCWLILGRFNAVGRAAS